MNDLRSALRDALRPEHDQLDAQVSSFDLARRDGLIAFLHMQAWGLGGLVDVVKDTETAKVVADLHGRARADCVAWTGCEPATGAGDVAHAHQMALAYIVGGARLGNTVLRRRWEKGGLGGSTYFVAPDYLGLWRSFCARAAEVPATDAAASTIIADAGDLFRHFLNCVEQAQRRYGFEYVRSGA